MVHAVKFDGTSNRQDTFRNTFSVDSCVSSLDLSERWLVTFFTVNLSNLNGPNLLWGPQNKFFWIARRTTAIILIAHRKLPTHMNGNGHDNLGIGPNRSACDLWAPDSTLRSSTGSKAVRVGNSSFNPFPFCSSILKPYFDLHLTKLQCVCNLRAFG